MTTPFMAPPAQGGQQGGFKQLPGGYPYSPGYVPPGQAPQQQQQWQPLQPQTQLGMPSQVAPPTFQQPPIQDGYPSSQIPQPPQQQPQYQQVPQQQVPQFQPPAPQFQAPPAGVDLNQRVGGPNVPAELQGRTVGELISIHNGLRQAHLASLQQPQPQQFQPVPPIQQVPQQQAGVPTVQPNQFDWRNPRESIANVVSEVLQRDLMPALAPTLQATNMQQVNTARNQVAQEIGPQLYAQLEPHILRNLQGIDPRALLNAETWRVAARATYGDLMLSQGRNGQQPQQQQFGFPVQQGQPNPQQPGVYYQPQTANGQPMPNLNGFFTEQPNQGGPTGQQGVRLTPFEDYTRRAMGLDEATYIAWKGGVPTTMNQPAQGGWR